MSRTGAGRRPGRLAAAALVVALASACAPAPQAAPSGTPQADLVEARRAAGIADCPQPAGEPVAGGLPELELECLGGDSAVTLSALRGPLVINLWAQWCLPCRQEAPVLRDFQAEHGDEVALLGIDYNDPQPGLAIEFAQLAGWTWPQLADPEKTTEVPLGLPGIPVSLLVDADGRVVARHAGAFTDLAELEAWVDEGIGS